MPPEARARALIAALVLLAGCGRERATSDSGVARPGASMPAPSVAEIDAYARHLDSLVWDGHGRFVVHPFGQEGNPNAVVDGFHLGDDLVVVRGPIGHDSLPYLRAYLRGGSPVLVTQSRDESTQRGAAPTSVVRTYLHGDTVIATRGAVRPSSASRLISAVEAFRKALAAPGRTLDSAATDTLAARPRAPYDIRGACPFECCRYGDWTLDGTTALRAEPRRNATVLRRVGPVAVHADSGFVRLDTIGLVVVTGLLTDDGSGIDYVPGDSILLLDYVGEGSFNAWIRGHRLQVGIFWDSAGERGARVVREPSSEWWAHLTLVEGADTVRGWMDMSDTVHVSGADACGG